MVDVSSDGAVVELYDLDADAQPTGRICIEIRSVDGSDDKGWLGGAIVRRIRTENGRVFVAVKFVLVPRAALRALQRFAETPIAV